MKFTRQSTAEPESEPRQSDLSVSVKPGWPQEEGPGSECLGGLCLGAGATAALVSDTLGHSGPGAQGHLLSLEAA